MITYVVYVMVYVYGRMVVHVFVPCWCFCGGRKKTGKAEVVQNDQKRGEYPAYQQPNT